MPEALPRRNFQFFKNPFSLVKKKEDLYPSTSSAFFLNVV